MGGRLVNGGTCRRERLLILLRTYHLAIISDRENMIHTQFGSRVLEPGELWRHGSYPILERELRELRDEHRPAYQAVRTRYLDANRRPREIRYQKCRYGQWQPMLLPYQELIAGAGGNGSAVVLVEEWDGPVDPGLLEHGLSWLEGRHEWRVPQELIAA